MTLSFEGILIGAFSFLVIGLFHPIVIKTEYYSGTRFWWAFLVVGILGCIGAMMVADVLYSSILSIVAFSSFWSVKELFEQRERVRKGWFPRNPRRSYAEEFGEGDKNRKR